MASRENLKKLSIKQLTQLLSDSGVVISEKLNKSELVEKVISLNASSKIKAPPIGSKDLSISALIPEVPNKDLPPFDKVKYEVCDPSDCPKVEFSVIYEFMVLRETCAQGQVMNFKGLDKATKHFDAGDVSNIMISKVDASTIYIKASCLASMKKLKYTVYICMALSGDKHTSQYAYCHCPIGLAQTCSHVGALLFALNKTGRERGNESVAPTDVLCQWKVPRNMTLKPVPVSDLNLSGARSAVDEDY